MRGLVLACEQCGDIPLCDLFAKTDPSIGWRPANLDPSEDTINGRVRKGHGPVPGGKNVHWR